MKKIIGLFVLLLLIVAAYFAYQKYNDVFAPNVPSSLAQPFLEIPSTSSYYDIKQQLIDQNILIDTTGFDWVAEKMNYKKETMRTGRFEIQPNWSNRELIGHLRSGKQATVKIILNTERLLEEVAARVGEIIEADSLDLIMAFKDTTTLQKLDLTEETLMTLFIPNTYDFYWGVSADDFLERMKKEHDKFWSTNSRKAKAAHLKMTPEEVYTLASIVERESLRDDERPTIAGVYLNRLERGIMLQADPTVVFALGQFDLRRVLNKHLKYDSPYNTYMYAGLPPGPISMASISSIDAVLNPQSHSYIYFCAKGDGSGAHSFARTLSEHNRNARIYHRNLKARGLR